MRLTLTFKLSPSPGEDTIDGNGYHRLREDMEEVGVKQAGLQRFGVKQVELRWLLDSTPAGAVMIDLEPVEEGSQHAAL